MRREYFTLRLHILERHPILSCGLSMNLYLHFLCPQFAVDIRPGRQLASMVQLGSFGRFLCGQYQPVIMSYVRS